MIDPTAVEFLGIHGSVYLWALTLAAFAVFGRRVSRHVQVLRRARPEVRSDQILRRARIFFVNVLGQWRLFDEPLFGAAHFFLFWAFVFFATSFCWNLLRGLFPALPVPYADEVIWMAAPMEVLAAIALAGLTVAAVRRYVFTPQSLERSWDASLVLVLIAIILVTYLAGQGMKVAAEPHTASVSFIGRWLGNTFSAREISPASARRAFAGLWWVHMLTVLGFLAYLPRSKHLHLLASPFGVFFAALEPGGMPKPSEGAARLEEFTWRQLFSGLSCAECGRCDRVCPAFASGLPLSPKLLVHKVKELVYCPPAAGNGNSHDGQKFVGDVVKPEELWACTTCYACMQRCPVFNEHIPLVVEMRRHLVNRGEVESRLQQTLMNLSRYGNSQGQSPRMRARWTQSVGFRVKDARKEPVEYLWFVGDYASYDPRVQAITRATARVLHAAGLDFGILYEAEQNSGNDVRRTGEEGLFEVLRDKNRRALAGAQFRTIVTTDPHSYHALKHEYAEGNGAFPWRVRHYTELLDELVCRGKLPLQARQQKTVTYHDPCYLGRYNGVYAAPRRVLNALGLRIREMRRNRETSFCCGAGGGRIWMEEPPGSRERPAESRVREAAAVAGVEALVVACPKDLVMFHDAIKTTGLEDRLVVRDLIELVEESLPVQGRSERYEAVEAQR